MLAATVGSGGRNGDMTSLDAPGLGTLAAGLRRRRQYPGLRARQLRTRLVCTVPRKYVGEPARQRAWVAARLIRWHIGAEQ